MSEIIIDRSKYRNTFNKNTDTDLFDFKYDEKYYRDNPPVPDEYRGHLKNYHTHTYRCNHATGDVPDYCLKAVELGFDTIGFTDHNPFPDNYLPDMRMSIEEFPDYLSDIAQAREDFKSLNIFAGLECDYRSEEKFKNFYKDYLLDEMGLDYLTGSVHVYPYNGGIRGVHGESMDCEMRKSYFDVMMKIIKSGNFCYINHPDLFGQQMDKWDKECEIMSRYVAEACKDEGVALELNTSGIAKRVLHPEEAHRLNYPIVQFWEIVSDVGCEVVVNTDAHHPMRLDSNLWYGLNLFKKLNLKPWKGL